MKFFGFASVAALALASCQPYSSAVGTAGSGTVQVSLSPQAQEGADLAEALCSGCHAIAKGQISPNPRAPSFVQVANMDNLTEQTLRDWLRDSHNFPEKMNFEVVPDDVEALAAYVITLREDAYTPPIE